MQPTAGSERGIPLSVRLARTTPTWPKMPASEAEALGPMAVMVHGGLNAIPIMADGTKSPPLKWTPYMKRRATPFEVATWIHKGFGYAIVCGLISAGLLVIDFDRRELYEPWYWLCQSIMERYQLPIVASPKGMHVYLRCSQITGNLKLAKEKDGSTLIETRGEGGYVIGPLNPRAVHPSGKLYLQIGGGIDLPQVPTIQPEEMMQLLRAAMSFDQFGIRERAKREEAKRLKAEQWKATHHDSGFRVGDDFRAKATWAEVLEPHGWTYAGASFWTRPGATPGSHSASVNRSADGSTSLLTVFSSNGGPLAPTTSDHATHDLFQVFALLNHNGDRKAAAKELRLKGYGA